MNKITGQNNLGQRAYQMVRDADMFGHSIHLNFNKQGDTYKTFWGGLSSWFIKGFLLFYFYLNFKRVVTYNNNLYQINDSVIENRNPISLKKENIGMTTFLHLHSLDGQKIHLNDVKNYLTIEYIQTEKTRSQLKQHGQYTHRKGFKARPCVFDDFVLLKENKEEAEKLYK